MIHLEPRYTISTQSTKEHPSGLKTALGRDEAIEKTARMLKAAQRVFVFTGAGLSAASGLKTFRGTGGYWNNIAVERLASRGGFEIDPETTWEFYNERIASYLEAEPNAAHYALVELAKLVPTFDHATQLVDGLILRAGATHLLELHGNIFKVKCTACDFKETLKAPFDLDRIQHCWNGRLRPGVVWFGESLPERTWEIAAQCNARADVILCIGTSAQVYPAASLAKRYNKNTKVIEINPSPELKDADIKLGEEAHTILPDIIEKIKNTQ